MKVNDIEDHQGKAEYIVNEDGMATGLRVTFDQPLNLMPGDKLELTFHITGWQDDHLKGCSAPHRGDECFKVPDDALEAAAEVIGHSSPLLRKVLAAAAPALVRQAVADTLAPKPNVTVVDSDQLMLLKPSGLEPGDVIYGPNGYRKELPDE